MGMFSAEEDPHYQLLEDFAGKVWNLSVSDKYIQQEIKKIIQRMQNDPFWVKRDYKDIKGSLHDLLRYYIKE